MKKLFNFKLCAIFLFGIFILASCDDNNSPEFKSNALGLGSGVSPDESYSNEEIEAMYDDIQVYAEIAMSKVIQDWKDSNGVIISNERNFSYASFWPNSVEFPPDFLADTLRIPVDSVIVNDVALEKDNDDNNYSSMAAPVYFGTQPNHIVVKDNDFVPTLDTHFTFYPEIRFQFPKPDDTLYSNQKISLRWNGRNSGYVYFNLSYLDMELMSQFPKNNGYLRDDGKFDINANDFRDTTKYPEGQYILVIQRFETFFPKFSNGNTYSVTGNSAHIISVYLKH